jgi:holo-[acyl-carrier protein] synthase
MYHNYAIGEHIKGTGTDLADIRRFRAMSAKKQEQLAEKILTPSECLRYKMAKDSARFLAKHFSAKERVAKALGTGFRGFGFRDIELGATQLGRPTVSLSERAKTVADKNKIGALHLSVSHERDYVLCFCIAESYDDASFRFRRIIAKR